MATLLELILERIANIEKTVNGISAVSPLTPLGVGVGLPLCINLAGNATYASEGNDGDFVRRNILVYLLINDAEADLTMIAQSQAVMYLDRLHQAFLKRRNLELDANPGLVHAARMLSDQGAGTIEYAGKQYIGVQFQLELQYYVATET